MFGEHRYSLHTTWTGDRGTGTSGYRDYDRAVTIEIDGKPALLASADKPFRGDPSRWNPEDLLLASLSECHLLSYLHACVQAGVVVVGRTRTTRRASWSRTGAAAGAFREVVLRPQVVVARGIDGGCRHRGARTGERVVLHRQFGELPGAARADDHGRRRLRPSAARAGGPA